MQSEVIMGIVPDGTMYPPGTPVWGTDYNAAYALLLRWWGVLDAPAHVQTAPMWADLADEEFSATLPDLQGMGRLAVIASVDALRHQGSSSHQLGFDDLRLAWTAPGVYQLDADVVEQRVVQDGSTLTRRCCVRAKLRKRADGAMVLRHIDGSVGAAEPATPFVPSYAVNRAKATMVQFQTHTDLLTGDAEGMRELLMPTLELNGLVNSKADQTRGDAAFTDVRSLRETISTSERRQDNVIRNFEDFTAWFATAPALFRQNGFHKLERFEVTPLADDRYQVIAQFHWQAETLNGAKIDLHTPLTWILVETGEKYMRIEKLLPFG